MRVHEKHNVNACEQERWSDLDMQREFFDTKFFYESNHQKHYIQDIPDIHGSLSCQHFLCLAVIDVPTAEPDLSQGLIENSDDKVNYCATNDELYDDDYDWAHLNRSQMRRYLQTKMKIEMDRRKMDHSHHCYCEMSQQSHIHRHWWKGS